MPAPRDIGLRLWRLTNPKVLLRSSQLIRNPRQTRYIQTRLHRAPSNLRSQGFGKSRWNQTVLSLPRNIKSRILGRLTKIRSFASAPRPNPTPQLGSPEPSPSLSQRLRNLSREYGWTALGVYLALSALDFPFCFLAVRMLGTERIGHWEHVIVDGAKKVVMYPFQTATQTQSHESGGLKEVVETEEGAAWNWGVDEAEEANNSGATLATQLALAYAIHKSFIFVRVPLTAAILPNVVKVLRRWGWDIGKRKPKITR